MKPNIPKGTRDFLPVEVRRRDYLFGVIRSVFVKYGYQPIETPVMESLDTLMGKYGDEGDQLLFKILNNGDFLKKADTDALQRRASSEILKSISKRGLRYDLTVPFARYVVMHQNELAFPFKRYAIQPVWRADRPQKGRYNEFYQCDADVVGSDSLYYEAELVRLFDEVFARLNLRTIIRLNNRKILAGIAEIAGAESHFADMTVAIDKLDKIGLDGVRRELDQRGVAATSTDRIVELLAIRSLSELEAKLTSSTMGLAGVRELKTVIERAGRTVNPIQFDITLARGLNYYTGCIFEVVVDTEAEGQGEIRMGSIGGGGRYDDLTGVFGMKNTSGVGISFGAERIYDVLLELENFPDHAEDDLQVLVLTFDEAALAYGWSVVSALRAANIAADLYPEPAKMKKQMKYADARGVPYVAVIGSREMEAQTPALKDMRSGTQELLSVDAMIERLRKD